MANFLSRKFNFSHQYPLNSIHNSSHTQAHANTRYNATFRHQILGFQLLIKEILSAKHEMINAYQERMDHFDKKLNLKDKEIRLLKETILFSRQSK